MVGPLYRSGVHQVLNHANSHLRYVYVQVTPMLASKNTVSALLSLHNPDMWDTSGLRFALHSSEETIQD